MSSDEASDFDSLFNIALHHQQNGNLEDSIELYQKLLATNPDNAGVYNNLANAYDGLNQTENALENIKKALALDPLSVDCNLNAGNFLFRLGRLEEAETYTKKAAEIDPDSFAVNYNLANVLQIGQKIDEAIEYYRRAIEINPDFAGAYNNLGNTLKLGGRVGEAIEAFEASLDLDPGNSMVYGNLGGLYTDIRRLKDAKRCYSRALDIDPDNKDAFDNYLFMLNYEGNGQEVEVYQYHLEWNRRFGPRTNNVSLSVGSVGKSNSGTGIIRVGLVSPDFKQHSVAFFVEPLMNEYDRNRFEFYCYSNVAREDEVTERIRSKASGWRSIVGMTDESVVNQIRLDEIDILIDLAGHTAGNRLTVFNYRAAPVQATWLGYPNTTGSRSIKYRITDEIADPHGSADNLHTERLVRLDTGFLCYQPGPVAPPLARDKTRESDNRVTFGSFNNITKITDEVVSVWSEILSVLPDSRLLIKSKMFAQTEVRETLLREFAQEGVEGERLMLMVNEESYEGHMQTYSLVDVALDSFPYNGTTTTCEALWMGVPVVTLSMNNHRSRVSGSILTRVGLERLISYSRDDYVSAAVNLANSPEYLSKLRMELRETLMRSTLCDAALFTKNMERALEEMLQEECS